MQLNPLESNPTSLPLPRSYVQGVSNERIAELVGARADYVASPFGMAALLAGWDEEDDD